MSHSPTTPDRLARPNAPAPVTAAASPAMTEAAYARLGAFAYHHTRIILPKGKEEMVRARLLRRLRATELSTFDAYVAHIESPQGESEARLALDLLTTNKTAFWREATHYGLLADVIAPEMKAGTLPAACWSAGCSSGEEPYTMAAVLANSPAAPRGPRVLATDFSLRALETARHAQYRLESFAPLPEPLRRRLVGPEVAAGTASIAEAIAAMVTFAPLNLIDEWPMRGPFAAIFCRNVMIYFDKKTQAELAVRFAELLAPGGYLCIGHSESLHGIAGPLQYVQPATYQRPRLTPTRSPEARS